MCTLILILFILIIILVLVISSTKQNAVLLRVILGGNPGPFIRSMGYGNPGNPGKHKKYEYQLSADGKYTAFVGPKGAEKLRHIWQKSQKAMDQLAKNFTQEDFQIAEKMYRSHTTDKKHTWPHEFYDDPRFCYAYIKYKTFQRYPEVHNMLERALPFLQNSKSSKNPRRVMLLGGGPGFSAQAVRDVFPNNPKVVNLDGSAVLGSVSHFYGAPFKQVMFHQTEEILKWANVDIIINSFAIEYLDQNLWTLILEQNPSTIILINCASTRGKYLRQLEELQRAKKLRVTPLIHMGDMRQFMITAYTDEPIPKKIKKIGKVTFPNVPYKRPPKRP